MNAFFYDTWAFIALGCASDSGHAIAVEADEWLEQHSFRAVTSDYVLDEAITGLHGLLGAQAVRAFMDDIEAQVNAGWLLRTAVTPGRWEDAERWFRRLSPQIPRLSFTDCTSFAVMADMKVRWAFTADRHFLRAGPKIHPLITRESDAWVFHRPLGSGR